MLSGLSYFYLLSNNQKSWTIVLLASAFAQMLVSEKGIVDVNK